MWDFTILHNYVYIAYYDAKECLALGSGVDTECVCVCVCVVLSKAKKVFPYWNKCPVFTTLDTCIRGTVVIL